MKTDAYRYIYENERSHWWYRVRRKIVHDLISQLKPGLREQAQILDIGCGMGLLMTELQKYGAVYGVDMSEQAVQYSRKRGLENVVLGDGVSLPYDDDTFDLVLALDVIEHIEDDNAAVSEIKRILKPGGRLIVFVPCFSFLWGMSDIVGKHFRRYTLSTLNVVVNNAGLCVERSSYFNAFLFPLVLLVRLCTRYLVKAPKLDYENTSSKHLNYFLFLIFNLESKLLRRVNFPFGVSGLMVCKKVEDKVALNN